METEITPKEPAEREAELVFARMLAQSGYHPSTPAYVITWGRLAEVIAQLLSEFGISPEQLDEDTLLDLARSTVQAVEAGEYLAWRELVRMNVRFYPTISHLLDTPDIDDEGVLTEQYENAIRLGDEEAYWVDGGASADWFYEE